MLSIHIVYVPTMTDELYTAGVEQDILGVYLDAGVLLAELRDVPGVLEPEPGV